METKTTAEILLGRVLRRPEFLRHPDVKPVFADDGMSLALADDTANDIASDAIKYAVDFHHQCGGLMDPGSSHHPIDMVRRRTKARRLSDDEETLIFAVVHAALTEFNRNYFAARARRRFKR